MYVYTMCHHCVCMCVHYLVIVILVSMYVLLRSFPAPSPLITDMRQLGRKKPGSIGKLRPMCGYLMSKFSDKNIIYCAATSNWNGLVHHVYTIVVFCTKPV